MWQYWTTSGCMWADGNGGVSVGCYYGVHGSIFSICSTSWKLEEDWHVCKFRTDRSVDPKIESEKGTNETWVFEKKNEPIHLSYRRTECYNIAGYTYIEKGRRGTEDQSFKQIHIYMPIESRRSTRESKTYLDVKVRCLKSWCKWILWQLFC